MKRIKAWAREVREHRKLILVSIIFLIISLAITYFMGDYTSEIKTVAVPDLILDHVPVVDLSFLFFYGFEIVIAVLLLYPLVFNVKEFHIAISQLSLLVLIRSLFTALTHLGVPSNSISIYSSGLYNWLVFQNDLFFSGHTAIPFLGFLLYRKEKIGIFFLIATVVLAATVLFMHLHYSIDVFAAIFIAYGSYKLGNWLFRKINHY